MQVLIVLAGVAHDLQRTVSVHVGRGAGAALDQVDDRLVMQRAGADLAAGGKNCIGQVESGKPKSQFAWAAASLIAAIATIRSDVIESVLPAIGKFSTARRV